jgi:hypothetical protein
LQTYPPTDSLYKFSAIIGTIVVVLSVYSMFKVNYTLSQEIIGQAQKVSVSMAEVKFLQRQQGIMQKIIDSHEASNKKGYKLDLTKVNLFYSNNEIKKLYMEIQGGIRNLAVEAAEINAIEAKIVVLKRLRIIATLSAFLGWLIGGSLALWGFKKWYWRIQVYQDKIIKQSVNEVEERHN